MILITKVNREYSDKTACLWVWKYTVKPVLSGHSKIDKTKTLQTNGGLMKVKSIAECSPWSILQYFWPALSDNRSWKPILVFFLSGRLRQVLLYYWNPYPTNMFCPEKCCLLDTSAANIQVHFRLFTMKAKHFEPLKTAPKSCASSEQK